MRPSRQLVERTSVLDRHRGLRAEGRQQLDVGRRELARAEIEDRQRAIDLARLAGEGDGQHRAQPFVPNPAHDLARKRYGGIVVEQRGEHRAALGDGDAGGALAERQRQAGHERLADRAGAAHRR